MIHTVKGFGIVSKAEIDVLLSLNVTYYGHYNYLYYLLVEHHIMKHDI